MKCFLQSKQYRANVQKQVVTAASCKQTRSHEALHPFGIIALVAVYQRYLNKSKKASFHHRISGSLLLDRRGPKHKDNYVVSSFGVHNARSSTLYLSIQCKATYLYPTRVHTLERWSFHSSDSQGSSYTLLLQLPMQRMGLPCPYVTMGKMPKKY